MTGTIAELLGLALVLATQGFLLLIAWDMRDDFGSMDRRLARRDARHAQRAARAGTEVRGERPARVGAR